MIDANIYELKKIISYDPKTGIITWTYDRYKAKAGSKCGHKDSNGYLLMKITINKSRKSYLLHRLAFALYYGRWPKEIDHINNDRLDNRIENLIEVSRGLNTARRRMKKRDLPRGVVNRFYVNKKNPFVAQCGNEFLGYFSNSEDAHAAYVKSHKSKYGDGELLWT